MFYPLRRTDCPISSTTPPEKPGDSPRVSWFLPDRPPHPPSTGRNYNEGVPQLATTRQRLIQLLIVLGPVLAAAQPYTFSPRIERTLRDTIHYEKLWDDSPKGFKSSFTGSATLAIAETEKEIWYCSRKLGVCAAYLTAVERNWMRNRSGICPPGNSDEAALVAYLNAKGVHVDEPSPSREPVVLRPKQKLGLVPLFPIRWPTTLDIKPTSVIRKEYQSPPPDPMDAVIQGIRQKFGSSSHFPVKIACFKPADPDVQVYAHGGEVGQFIFSMFWDREREGWRFTASLSPEQGQPLFDRRKAMIESLTCREANL